MLVIKERGVVVFEKRTEVRYVQNENRKVKIGCAYIPPPPPYMSEFEEKLQRAFLKK